MDASVIVSNYDGKDQLVACVRAALQQEGDARHEVVFPFHGAVSAAERAELGRIAEANPGLRLLPIRTDNRAIALAEASRHAAADLLLIVESHCTAPADLVATGRRVIADAKADVVIGDFPAANPRTWVARAEEELRLASRRVRTQKGLPPAEWNVHVAAFRREAFEATLLDTTVPGICEVPLLERLVEQGRTVRTDNRLRVRHLNHDAARHFAGALFERGREYGKLWRREPDLAARVFPVPALERHPRLVRATRPALRLMAGTGRGAAWAVLGLAHGLRLRNARLRALRWVASASVRAGFLRGLGG